MSFADQFLDGYAKTLTWVVRLLGVLSGLMALMILIAVLVVTGESPWWYVLSAFHAGLCVAIFIAKPITGSDMRRSRQETMGRTHTSPLRQNSPRGVKDGDAGAH
jgi:uncharacterized membrane protein YqjE